MPLKAQPPHKFVVSVLRIYVQVYVQNFHLTTEAYYWTFKKIFFYLFCCDKEVPRQKGCNTQTQENYIHSVEPAKHKMTVIMSMKFVYHNCFA